MIGNLGACCACNGSCMHVGPHSYCDEHTPKAQTLMRPDLATWPWPKPLTREITVEELAAALDKLGLKAVPK